MLFVVPISAGTALTLLILYWLVIGIEALIQRRFDKRYDAYVREREAPQRAAEDAARKEREAATARMIAKTQRAHDALREIREEREAAKLAAQQSNQV